MMIKMLKNGLLAIISLLYVSTVYSADLQELCAKYASNPDYQKTMAFFAYRLKDVAARYGCEVIPLYYAFADEKSAGILSTAEDNPEIMKELIDIINSNAGLAPLLAKNPDLAQALDLSIVEKEDGYESFLARLKTLNSRQIELISQGKPAAAALAILVPNLSPAFLSKNFTSTELETLLGLVAMCAMTSASIDTGEVQQLIPYFTTNPNDAAKVYKEVIRAWGQNNLKDVLIKNSGVVPALVPPLSSDEMKDFGILNWTPEQFQRMQKEYISIMRNIYKKADHEYGPSWAKEICMAFSDSLAAALLAANPEEQADICKFLLAFIGNGELFRKVFLGSGCFEINNIQILGEFINDASVEGQILDNRTQALTALADWFSSGQLGNLLQDWINSTDEKKFSLGMRSLQEEVGKSVPNDDAVFWTALIDLAMFRKSLAPEQKKIIDYLLNTLAGVQRRPSVAVAFMNEIKVPLFNALQPGRYVNPQTVADHLLNYGYPESQNPSLYQYFVGGDAQGYMPAAGEAIEERGKLPEAKLLEHGRTFADWSGGYTVEDIIDAADITISIGFALTATVGTGGAAAGSIPLAMGRVATKQAAKRLAQETAKALAKGAAKMPKLVRPILGAGARMGGRVLLKAAEKAPKAFINAPRAFDIASDSYDIWDGLRAARKLYLALGGAGLAFEIGQEEAEPICPGKAKE